MAIAALNKSEQVGEGLELLCESKGSQLEYKGNRGVKENKAAGEGLELVRGTKGSQWEDKEHRQERNPVVCKSSFETDWD